MKRIVPGILLALAWLLLLLEGTPRVFSLALLVIACIGANEYLGMSWEQRPGLGSRIYLILTMVLPVLSAAVPVQTLSPQGGLIGSFLLLTLYFVNRYTHFEDSYKLLSRMAFGTIYIGLLAAHLIMLRYMPEGGRWLVVLTAITAGSDTGAYFVGSAFGRRKLCPGISPKKTVEGAVGGLACGVTAALVASVLLFAKTDFLLLSVLAVVLTGVGILGDLMESIVKRGTGTKDSGRLLAGHGGVLDRIDSLLLTGPVLFYLLQLLGVQ